MLVFNIYRTAFVYFQMGYASAMAYVLFLVVLAFTVVQWVLAEAVGALLMAVASRRYRSARAARKSPWVASSIYVALIVGALLRGHAVPLHALDLAEAGQAGVPVPAALDSQSDRLGQLRRSPLDRV